MKLVRILTAAAFLLGLHSGCSRNVLVGAEERARTSPLADAAIESGAGEGGAADCVQVKCLNKYYACGDCVDNEGDGKIDADDPDCLGPCQNAEDTFYPSIPGQNHPGCAEDCYFDADSGGGNDRCAWSHTCDPLSPDTRCPHDPAARDCDVAQPAECVDSCLPLTPNGCDCFGCCLVAGAAGPVWLGSVDEDGNASCTLADAADPARCHPCTQVPGCLNPCAECELCVGRIRLPETCGAAGECVAPACAEGAAPCGLPCLPRCPEGKACITGCCADPPRQP